MNSWKKQRLPLLLHVCCGPCATHAIDRLREKYDPIGFFFNPNIQPDDEFIRRLKGAARVCRACGIPLWIPEYRPKAWMHAVQGKEGTPEGGERCQICYAMRMDATAILARGHSIPVFSTTLTTSPHKNSQEINDLGEIVAGKRNVSFAAYDFKEGDGFKISVERSRKLGLYRQKYCGCSFSL